MFLSAIALCVCGWSGRDQYVTSSPFHTVHTWMLLFDLQLLLAELVRVCNSASCAHLRPKSSALKTPQLLIAASLPALPSVFSVLTHDKVLETLFTVYVCAAYFHLPPHHHSPLLEQVVLNNFYTQLWTYFSFKEQSFHFGVLIALLWEKSPLLWYQKQDTIYENCVLAFFFFFNQKSSGHSDEADQKKWA